MKKILILSFTVLIFFGLFQIQSSKNEVQALNSHKEFVELNLEGDAKLISEYNADELYPYYKSVEKRKMGGWRVKMINNGVPATFTSDIITSFYNEGTTPIDYNFKFTRTTESTFSLDATNELSVSVEGKYKVFKGGLDEKLKIKSSYSTAAKNLEEESVKVLVDPDTRLGIFARGEGRLYNGVAAHYTFFFRDKTGGFEYFVTTTQYRSLEKTR